MSGLGAGTARREHIRLVDPPGSGVGLDATEAASSADGAWSAEAMIARLGDEDLVRQLVTLFLAEYARMMAVVRDSVASGQPDAIRAAAHALKGSVANFTDGSPTTTAFELEQIGRSGRLHEAQAVLERLEREVERFVGALQAFQEKNARSHR